VTQRSEIGNIKILVQSFIKLPGIIRFLFSLTASISLAYFVCFGTVVFLLLLFVFGGSGWFGSVVFIFLCVFLLSFWTSPYLWTCFLTNSLKTPPFHMCSELRLQAEGWKQEEWDMDTHHWPGIYILLVQDNRSLNIEMTTELSRLAKKKKRES